MTSIFNDVELTWAGETYTVPPTGVMRLIGKIEEHVRVKHLLDPEGVPMARLASAYGAALRHAGAAVSDEEVYAALFADGKDFIPAAVNGLLMIIVPPDKRSGGKAPKAGTKKKPKKKGS